jgi:hypothetical protein
LLNAVLELANSLRIITDFSPEVAGVLVGFQWLFDARQMILAKCDRLEETNSLMLFLLLAITRVYHALTAAQSGGAR